eukprot:g5339.t1
MRATVQKLWSSTQLADTLTECPFLLLFLFPWTVAAMTAFIYVQGSLMVAILWTRSAWEILFNAIGCFLCFPWLLLALKSISSTCSSILEILRKLNGIMHCVYHIKEALEPWIPRTRNNSFKVVFVLVVWLVASLPFSLLIGQLIDESKIMLAVVLALLLTPYWLLSGAGVYLVITACFKGTPELCEQIELVSHN